MSNVLLLRFDDSADDDLIRPRDELEHLADMANTGAAMPAIVEAAAGLGRFFVSSDADGISAIDIDAGATLVTRDATIQVIMAWDLEAAATYASPQTIYARGKGTAAAEYMGAGLELRVVNAAARIGEVRWIWHDLAGVLKTQIGGHFQVPEDGYMLITATRRWISSSRVVLRHYLGDSLLSEVESVDGSIGGGTTGTTSIGTRYTGAAWGRFLDGVVDELRVLDEELSAEEISATWERITVEQPNGYRMLVEAHDPGFPIATDPASRAQRETRLWGHGLGYASGQAENIRANILPDRAYGRVLERWESITRQPRTASDDVDARRRRVVGKIRQKRGASLPGVGDAVGDLLDVEPSNLDYIAFTQTTHDTWETLNELRWRHDPAANWTTPANALRVLSAGDVSTWALWRTSLVDLGGDGREAKIWTKITPTTIDASGEVGITFLDRAHQHGFYFGLRNDAGTYRLVTGNIASGVFGAATNRAAPGLVPLWLLLSKDADGTYRIAYATVSADGPYTTIATIAGTLTTFQWGGFYARTISAVAANINATFDDTYARAPYGNRPFFAYVLRDPALPGSPDFLGANSVLAGLKHVNTSVRSVSTLEAKCDSDDTTCDDAPMGGI